MKDQIKDRLEIILATLIIFKLKTQLFHWNVTGKEFYSLHKIFQSIYEQIELDIDVIGETIRMLDFKVKLDASSLKIKSAVAITNSDITSHEMLLEIITDIHNIIVRLLNIRDAADKQGEVAIVAFIDDTISKYEKFVYFLKSSQEDVIAVPVK